jgi:hypothetical protein
MRVILQESGELRIRRGSDADLDPLVEVFGERSYFGDCLAKQRAGGGALLVAWSAAGRSGTCSWTATRPRSRRSAAGGRACRGSTTWRSSPRCSGAASAPPCSGPARPPPASWATAGVALGVGLDNPDARRLYERLGYADWAHGSIVATYQDRDRDGPPVTITETIDMLVKPL